MERRLGAIEKFRRLAMARGNIYYLFSSAFLSEPSYTLVTNVLKKEFMFSISHVIDDDRGVKLLRHFTKSFKHDRKGYKALTKEYRDLFLTSGARFIRPYESAYRDEMVVNDVKNMYGWAKARIPRLGNFPDHFGLELWFMYHLCNLEAKAWTKRNKELALRHLEVEEAFLERHLTKWAGELCSRVTRLSTLDFYRGVAEITKEYIAQDYREVKELIKEARDL